MTRTPVSYTHLMAPEPDDDDDETWVLFNAMNGNRAEMSPEAAGIAACLMTVSYTHLNVPPYDAGEISHRIQETLPIIILRHSVIFIHNQISIS